MGCDKIKEGEVGVARARRRETRNVCRFSWETKEKIQFGRSWHRREDNIKVDLKELGLEHVD
jgi:hypothetical protein